MSRVLHLFEHNLAIYRRSWRGTVMVTFVAPVLFLSAMGLGVGGLIDRRSGGLNGVSYLAFLAPGLIAASAMQTAAGEAMFPIMSRIKWLRTYEAILATPARVRDLLIAELGWIGLKLALAATVFFAVTVLFGIPRSPLAVLAVPVAVLTGMAFAAPIMAFTATQDNATGFNYVFRFGLMPLYLFGGAFFPISRLPLPVQAVLWATPISHGVALGRDLVLGSVGTGPVLIHLAVPLFWFGAGTAAAAITLTRRLRV